MHPPPPGAAMDFSQNSLFGYMEDLQELTIIERPVRRSLKVRPGEEELSAGARRRVPAPTRVLAPPRGGPGPPRSRTGPSVLLRSPCHPKLAPLGAPSSTRPGSLGLDPTPCPGAGPLLPGPSPAGPQERPPAPPAPPRSDGPGPASPRPCGSCPAAAARSSRVLPSRIPVVPGCCPGPGPSVNTAPTPPRDPPRPIPPSEQARVPLPSSQPGLPCPPSQRPSWSRPAAGLQSPLDPFASVLNRHTSFPPGPSGTLAGTPLPGPWTESASASSPSPQSHLPASLPEAPALRAGTPGSWTPAILLLAPLALLTPTCRSISNL